MFFFVFHHVCMETSKKYGNNERHKKINLRFKNIHFCLINERIIIIQKNEEDFGIEKKTNVYKFIDGREDFYHDRLNNCENRDFLIDVLVDFYLLEISILTCMRDERD